MTSVSGYLLPHPKTIFIPSNEAHTVDISQRQFLYAQDVANTTTIQDSKRMKARLHLVLTIGLGGSVTPQTIMYAQLHTLISTANLKITRH